MDTAVSAVADVEPTGQYNENGSEILDVTVPAGAVSVVTSAVSEELGTMVDAGALVESLNGVSGRLGVPARGRLRDRHGAGGSLQPV